MKQQVASIEYKYPIEQANTAFGQGINVTGLPNAASNVGCG